MENNKNHQIESDSNLLFWRVDRDEPKYQKRSPYGFKNAIIATDERYSDCFHLHSTVATQSSDEFLQIIYGTEGSILQRTNSIGLCLSADARMSKVFAKFTSQRIPGLR